MCPKTLALLGWGMVAAGARAAAQLLLVQGRFDELCILTAGSHAVCHITCVAVLSQTLVKRVGVAISADRNATVAVGAAVLVFIIVVSILPFLVLLVVILLGVAGMLHSNGLLGAQALAGAERKPDGKAPQRKVKSP